MIRVTTFSVLILTACNTLFVRGQTRTANVTQWKVEGEQREAIVIPPTKKTTEAIPLLFVFHGHGGTMRLMERKGFQKLWPEALVVCPQGVPTATFNDSEGKQAGWQPRVGANQDRDLKFVDTMLKSLRAKYKIDDRHVFVTGHSNGGVFAYLLWSARGKEFAAIAPVAAVVASARLNRSLQPIPVMHIAGEKDEIVPFANQQRSMEFVRKVNDCDAQGKEWANVGKLKAMLYPSKTGAPVVAVIHPGTHVFPEEAPELIVRFFKEHARQ